MSKTAKKLKWLLFRAEWLLGWVLYPILNLPIDWWGDKKGWLFWTLPIIGLCVNLPWAEIAVLESEDRS